MLPPRRAGAVPRQASLRTADAATASQMVPTMADHNLCSSSRHALAPGCFLFNLRTPNYRWFPTDIAPQTGLSSVLRPCFLPRCIHTLLLILLCSERSQACYTNLPIQARAMEDGASAEMPRLMLHAAVRSVGGGPGSQSSAGDHSHPASPRVVEHGVAGDLILASVSLLIPFCQILHGSCCGTALIAFDEAQRISQSNCHQCQPVQQSLQHQVAITQRCQNSTSWQ